MAALGGKSAAQKMTPEQRSARAKKGAKARWKKSRKPKKAVEAATRATRKPKAVAPWVDPLQAHKQEPAGMPGHATSCQCMACRAYRAGWRP